MQQEKSHLSILFVEDEKEVRENYVLYLKMVFDEVYEAQDGEEAYRIYARKKPKIMIVDINLPKLNGIDLVKKIRIHDPVTKIILLTAHTDKKFLLEAASLKLTKYLVKPISRKELREALDMVKQELDSFDTIPLQKANLRENYQWDYQTEELRCNNHLITLTAKERKVFSVLMNHLGETVSTDAIIYEVWDDYHEGNYDRLKTIIKLLRKKLPKDTIENVFATGYKVAK